MTVGSKTSAARAASSQQERLIMYAAWAAVAVAFALVLVKLGAWLLTGAVGILATFVDSLLDLCASGINMLAIRYALQEADAEHRFGHGKAEALAGLAQGLFIASSALFLLVFALERIVNPEIIVELELGLGVMAFSLLVTGCLVLAQRYVVRKTGSLAVKADSLHYSADLLSGLAVILGMVLYWSGWLYADPVIAVLISLWILKTALSLLYESTQHLLDRELPDEQRERIIALASAVEGVLELHDLRTRQSGQQCFIQLHVSMAGEISLAQAHVIGEEVERCIMAEFSSAEVLVHHDPFVPEQLGPEPLLSDSNKS